MALTIEQQYDVAIGAISEGDIDALAKILINPAAATISDQQTVAERLGFKRGFLSAAVNTAADPLVWISAFLSRKFPTQAIAGGSIPKRFVGAANEFSGLSLIAKPTESMFRGTLIPRLNSLQMHRQAVVLKAAEPLKRLMDRPNWVEEMPIVSMLREGGNPAGATPELRRVEAEMAGHMRTLWRFNHRAQKIQGGLNSGVLPTARNFTPEEAPKFLRDYLPHIPLAGNESTFQLSGADALRRLGGQENRAVAQALDAAGVKLTDVWKKSGIDKLSASFGDFQRFVTNVGSTVYNPHLFKRVRHGLKLATPKGQELFYTDLNLVLNKYISSTARSYAINAPLSPHERAIASFTTPEGVRKLPTEEPIIVQMIREGLGPDGVNAKFTIEEVPGTTFRDASGAVRGPTLIKRMVPGSGSIPMLEALKSLTRAVKGSQGEDQILWGALYNRVFDGINKVKGRFTKKQEAQMVDSTRTILNGKDHRHKADAITSYLYSTTLGLNFKSAFQNLLQPIITTVPHMGIGNTLAGLREFQPRVRKFASDVATELRSLPSTRKGFPRAVEAAKRAFEKNFPELVDQQIGVDPRLFDLSQDALNRMVSPTGKFIDYDSFTRFLLAPFTASELSNRAVTFFGAKNQVKHAIRTGEYRLPKLPNGKELSKIHIDELLNFEASNIVNATQFRPGPGSRTVVQSMVPSFIRQFTTFPVRLLNFFAESTVRGAATQEQLNAMGLFDRLLSLNGRNLGTVARTFLAGKIANNALRDVLGVDITNSIGLTLPFQPAPEGSILGVLPVPPAPSVLFGVLSATANRDIEKLQPLELPGGIKTIIPRALFPAGIQLNRVFRLMNQFRPDKGGFVDDQERLVYRGDTKDAILRMIGIPLDKGRRERQIMERLTSVRNVDRDLSRQLRVAAARFDVDEMDRVKRKHRELFPDSPGLNISRQQLNVFRASQRKTRVMRMLQTLPGRFDFLEEQIYDVDPSIIEPQPPFRGLSDLLAG